MHLEKQAGTYCFPKVMGQMGPLGVEEDAVILAFGVPLL